MLGKLLKHEWKAIWKVPVMLICILMILAAVAGLTFALPVWDSEWVGLPLSGMMLIIVFYISMIACGVGIVIYFAVRFYKSMFTDEGYLTHTLPVNVHQLLLNKVITMSAWSLLGGIAILLSLVVFGSFTVMSLVPRNSTFARDVVEAVQDMFLMWPELLKEPGMEGFSGFCISILVLVLFSSFSGTMTIIGSITLGQQVRKHRILGAIGAYFAISMGIQFVNMAVMVPLMFTWIGDTRWERALSPFPAMTLFYSVMAAVSLAVSVGLYFLSEYLIRRQLELE